MNVFVSNDYSYMQDCIVCYPCNLQAANNSNIQVDKTLVSVQYNNFVNKLIQHGVKVQFVALNGSPSQVFTRDIGFVVEDILFISNMTDVLRQSEIDGLKELAGKYNLKTHIMEQRVEGGDIMVDNNVIFIGQGNRTNEMSANEIGYVLEKNNKRYEIVKVAFEVSKIHLDCVFNILDKETCIVSAAVYNPEIVVKYFKRVIKVPDEYLKEFAPNIVQLGNNNYLCSSKNFTSTLKREGFNAEYLDFSEIMKCNGSLGCCALPLNRS